MSKHATMCKIKEDVFWIIYENLQLSVLYVDKNGSISSLWDICLKYDCLFLCVFSLDSCIIFTSNGQMMIYSKGVQCSQYKFNECAISDINVQTDEFRTLIFVSFLNGRICSLKFENNILIPVFDVKISSFINQIVTVGKDYFLIFSNNYTLYSFFNVISNQLHLVDFKSAKMNIYHSSNVLPLSNNHLIFYDQGEISLARLDLNSIFEESSYPKLSVLSSLLPYNAKIQKLISRDLLLVVFDKGNTSTISVLNFLSDCEKRTKYANSIKNSYIGTYHFQCTVQGFSFYKNEKEYLFLFYNEKDVIILRGLEGNSLKDQFDFCLVLNFSVRNNITKLNVISDNLFYIVDELGETNCYKLTCSNSSFSIQHFFYMTDGHNICGLFSFRDSKILSLDRYGNIALVTNIKKGYCKMSASQFKHNLTISSFYSFFGQKQFLLFSTYSGELFFVSNFDYDSAVFCKKLWLSIDNK